MSSNPLSSLPILNLVSPLVGATQRKLNEYRLDTIGTFHFDIVQGCQLRCIGCPNSILLPKIDHITPEAFDVCLQNVDVKRVKVMRLFNFGEPFLHPDLKGLMDVLKT